MLCTVRQQNGHQNGYVWIRIFLIDFNRIITQVLNNVMPKFGISMFYYFVSIQCSTVRIKSDREQEPRLRIDHHMMCIMNVYT